MTNASSTTVNRVVCYCDDCQAFLHYLKRADLLDAHGGTDIVQVYSEAPPRLVGFARVDVAAGSAKDVEIVIPSERLAARDVEQHAMVVRRGAYDLRIARSAADAGMRAGVEIS